VTRRVFSAKADGKHGGIFERLAVCAADLQGPLIPRLDDRGRRRRRDCYVGLYSFISTISKSAFAA
jgi:hypothetical protein